MLKKNKLILMILMYTSVSFNAVAQQLLSSNNPGNQKVVAGKKAKKYYLFSYFLNQDKGMYYALSTDGDHWQPLNNGQPYLTPEVGQKLIRDPSICKGPDGTYHLVWTSGWSGKEIGYSSSKDLVHWENQRPLALMDNVKETVNCWAPEIFYDDRKSEFIVYWSTTLSANGVYSDGVNYIYYCTTKDFKTFSVPAILFTNGQSGGGKAGNNGVIDAFIYKKAKSSYVLFYKKDDNTGVPNLFYRTSKRPDGEWGNEIGPILPSTGDEGPWCIKIGDEYRVYTDPFESDKAYIFISKDLKNWHRETSDLKMSHGCVIEIPQQLADRLLNK